MCCYYLTTNHAISKSSTQTLNQDTGKCLELDELCSNMIFQQTACPSKSRKSTVTPSADDCQTVHPLPDFESEIEN